MKAYSPVQTEETRNLPLVNLGCLFLVMLGVAVGFGVFFSGTPYGYILVVLVAALYSAVLVYYVNVARQVRDVWTEPILEIGDTHVYWRSSPAYEPEEIALEEIRRVVWEADRRVCFYLHDGPPRVWTLSNVSEEDLPRLRLALQAAIPSHPPAA